MSGQHDNYSLIFAVWGTGLEEIIATDFEGSAWLLRPENVIRRRFEELLNGPVQAHGPVANPPPTPRGSSQGPVTATQ